MAFGRKNKVNLNPLSYNICLLGESKCGKTTLIKEVCEKLTGEDGYLFLETGMERGADAIEGINYVNCPEWWYDYDELTNSIGFADVCDDIIENKTTEYASLQVVVIDTYDHVLEIAEKEALRLYNKECRDTGHPEKIAKTINQSWGGFYRGEKKALDMILDYIAQLKQVGVSTIVIGHVKTKDLTDAVTGENYQILTSDQQSFYFNALKKNLHFLGLAYIDRTIIKEKTGKKNITTKKEETINKITSETRKVRFRDDSYTVDSGSRFANIVPEIDMNADDFIKALTDAIECERQKSGKTLKESQIEQQKLEKAEYERVIAKEKENKMQKELDEIISQIVDFFAENKSDLNMIKPIMTKVKELGYTNPKEISSLEDAKVVLAEILR